MDFGAILKNLRHDKGMTQEQLADILSISSQAVSRWECNTAMPDISMLPPLANLFNVTTDYLLGVDVSKRDERIERLRNDLHTVAPCEMIDESFQLRRLEKARAALLEYPSSNKLKNTLCLILCNLLPYCETGGERFNAYVEEIKSVSEDVIAHAQNYEESFQAISNLCIHAREISYAERIKELCYKLSNTGYSRERMLLYVLAEDELDECARYYIYQLMTDHLVVAFCALGKGKSAEIKRKYHQKYRDIERILYDNDDYIKTAFYNFDHEYDWALELAKIGDNDGAFECLERSYARYLYGAEHGHTFFSDLHTENLKPEFEYQQQRTIDDIRVEYSFKLQEKLLNVAREFPDLFKKDSRYEIMVQTWKAFIEKYAEK